MRLAPVGALAALVALGACAAPSNPTWTEDVKPILQANCVRCHGKVRRNGAPRDFRLDYYEGRSNELGQFIRGANSLAEFAFERAHEETMPPAAPLSGVQIATLENWFRTRDANNSAAFGDPVGSDPELELLTPIDDSLSGDGFIHIQYRLSDADFDVVSGAIEARSASGDIDVPGELYSGTGEVSFDLAGAPPETYELVAVLNDGNFLFGDGIEVSLGTVQVAPANAAPTVAINFLAVDDIFPAYAEVRGDPPPPDPDGCGNGVLDRNEGCDDGSPDLDQPLADGDGCNFDCKIENTFACNVDVNDPDMPAGIDDRSCASGFCDKSGGEPGVCTDTSDRIIFTVDDADGDPLDVVVSAIRGEDESPINLVLDNVAPGRYSLQVPSSEIPASASGGGWFVRVGVTDGQLSRSATVGPIIIRAGAASMVDFESTISGLLRAHCDGCHEPDGFSGIAFDTTVNVESINNIRRAFGGQIFRRVIVERSMPPTSTTLINNREQMPQADRDVLAEWLLGGAPETLP